MSEQIDPVRGKSVDTTTALRAEKDGLTFLFCSEHGLNKFQSNTKIAPELSPQDKCCQASGETPARETEAKRDSACDSAK